MSKKPGRGSDQFPLRLPAGMREQIKRFAETSGRSMNQEIVEALREMFPEEPTLEELIDEFAHATSLIEELEELSDIDPETLQTVAGRLYETSERITKALSSRHEVRTVRLDQDVLDRVISLRKTWNLGTSAMNESLINNLVRMSLSRVENRQESLKVTIGEGDDRRVVEIIPPWEEQPQQTQSQSQSTDD